MHAENVSRKTAIALGRWPRFSPPRRRDADRILRTRKPGKSHLRSEPGRERGSNAADAAQALDRAERAEGIAVRDDPRGEGGTHSVEGFDERGRRGVHVDG